MSLPPLPLTILLLLLLLLPQALHDVHLLILSFAILIQPGDVRTQHTNMWRGMMWTTYLLYGHERRLYPLHRSCSVLSQASTSRYLVSGAWSDLKPSVRLSAQENLKPRIAYAANDSKPPNQRSKYLRPHPRRVIPCTDRVLGSVARAREHQNIWCSEQNADCLKRTGHASENPIRLLLIMVRQNCHSRHELSELWAPLGSVLLPSWELDITKRVAVDMKTIIFFVLDGLM